MSPHRLLKSMNFLQLCGLCALAGFLFGGCSPTPAPKQNTVVEKGHADHDDHVDHADHADNDDHPDHAHEHPTTYDAAVSELEKLRMQVKTHLADGDKEKADGPVHAIGHLMGDLKDLAAKENLDETSRDSIDKASEELMDCFGQIDATLHGGEGKTYDEVSARIDAAMTVLMKKGSLDIKASEKSDDAPEPAEKSAQE